MCESYSRAEVFVSDIAGKAVVTNAAGHVFLADSTNSRIRRYAPLSVTDHTAPDGTKGWDTLTDGLPNIWGMALCPNGNLYWAERTDQVVNVLECADESTPSNGVCYRYASDSALFYNISYDGFNGMPYHVACGADNDLAVSTVSSGGDGGYVHFYNAQNDQWMLLTADGVLSHTVGVSFTPEADIKVIANDDDGAYHLYTIKCDVHEPSSPGVAPACASYGNDASDFNDADGDGFVSVSFSDDQIEIGDYNWGNVVVSADGTLLIMRDDQGKYIFIFIFDMFLDNDLLTFVQVYGHSLRAIAIFHCWIIQMFSHFLIHGILQFLLLEIFLFLITQLITCIA